MFSLYALHMKTEKEAVVFFFHSVETLAYEEWWAVGRQVREGTDLLPDMPATTCQVNGLICVGDSYCTMLPAYFYHAMCAFSSPVVTTYYGNYDDHSTYANLYSHKVREGGICAMCWKESDFFLTPPAGMQVMTVEEEAFYVTPTTPRTTF